MSYHGAPDRRPPYPAGVPSKFAADTGAAQPFPGNTIVAHVRETTHPALHASLLRLHGALTEHQRALTAAGKPALFALLPPASWHMTVFEGVCDGVRDGPHGEGRGVAWPTGPLSGATLGECTAAFTETLKGFSLRGTRGGQPQWQGPPYKMRLAGWEPLRVGIGLHVELRDGDEDARFRALRDRLSAALGVRSPHHDVYGLHVSIAYFIRWMDDAGDEERALRELFDRVWTEEWGGADASRVNFDLGAPEWCTFDDMFEFKRIFCLGDGEAAVAGTDQSAA